MEFPDFLSVESYLNSLVNYEQTFPLGGSRDRPKLQPTLSALARLKLPLSLPNCVHIAGTKGKGSVVAFLECLLSTDHSVLSFTSPHLVSVKERVRLRGKMLDDRLWRKGFQAITEALQREPAVKLTYFEIVFVFFAWASVELHADVNIVEAGLGGRWDATNVLDDTLAVLTLVDYDHTEILGNTLTEIASDKSGIVKPNARVVVASQPEEALQIYRARIADEHASAWLSGGDYAWRGRNDGQFHYSDSAGEVDGISLAVSGVHQYDNAAVAIQTARLLSPGLDPAAIRTRLANCRIPGRQQLLQGTPDVLLDVAHNPISFQALAATLRERYGTRKMLAVIGMMKNKDARGSLEALRGLVNDLLLVDLHNPRSYRREELCEIAESLGFNADCSVALEAAFSALHTRGDHDLGLVAGSFYLAGDYLMWRQRAGIA